MSVIRGRKGRPLTTSSSDGPLCTPEGPGIDSSSRLFCESRQLISEPEDDEEDEGWGVRGEGEGMLLFISSREFSLFWNAEGVEALQDAGGWEFSEFSDGDCWSKGLVSGGDTELGLSFVGMSDCDTEDEDDFCERS